MRQCPPQDRAPARPLGTRLILLLALAATPCSTAPAQPASPRPARPSPAPRTPNSEFRTPDSRFPPLHPASFLISLEDAWNYAHVEYLSQIFCHSSTHPRYLGPGEPLVGTSWRNRPVYVGWFVGALFPDDLVGGRVAQDTSLFGGYHLGWDFDHYWGAQWRIGWSNPDLHYPSEPLRGGNSQLTLTDLDLLYYPWGDSAVRPYALLGLGITSADFPDDEGVYQDETLISVPFGGGIKHHYRRWLSWRVELLNNFALGDGDVNSMHNVSLTLGIEVHFGVRPRSYYPWNPSRHIW